MNGPENGFPASLPGDSQEGAAESPSTGGAPIASPRPASAEPSGVPAVVPVPEAALPEDLRAPWNWSYLALFVVFAFVTLVGLEIVFAAFAMVKLQLNLEELQKLAMTNAPYVTARQAVWFAGLMLYLFVMMRLHHKAPFWRTIGWRPLRPRSMAPAGAATLCLLGGFALAVTIALTGKFVGTKAKLPIEELFRDRQGALLVLALAVLGAPLVEETVFRGYIYPVVARSLGVPAGVVVTGILFGLLHAPQLAGTWGLVALLAAVGTVLSYVRARTGTVLASYLLHLGYNSTLFIAFAIATRGFRHFPPTP